MVCVLGQCTKPPRLTYDVFILITRVGAGFKLSQNSPNVVSWLRGVKGYLNAKNRYNFYFLGSMSLLYSFCFSL